MHCRKWGRNHSQKHEDDPSARAWKDLVILLDFVQTVVAENDDVVVVVVVGNAVVESAFGDSTVEVDRTVEASLAAAVIVGIVRGVCAVVACPDHEEYLLLEGPDARNGIYAQSYNSLAQSDGILRPSYYFPTS